MGSQHQRRMDRERMKRFRGRSRTVTLPLSSIAVIDALRPLVSDVTGNASASRPDVVVLAVKQLAHTKGISVAGNESCEPPVPGTEPLMFCPSLIAPADEPNAPASTLPSRATPTYFGGGRIWLENDAVFVAFAKPDPRKEHLKGRAYQRTDVDRQVAWVRQFTTIAEAQQELAEVASCLELNEGAFTTALREPSSPVTASPQKCDHNTSP